MLVPWEGYVMPKTGNLQPRCPVRVTNKGLWQAVDFHQRSLEGNASAWRKVGVGGRVLRGENVPL